VVCEISQFFFEHNRQRCVREIDSCRCIVKSFGWISNFVKRLHGGLVMVSVRSMVGTPDSVTILLATCCALSVEFDGPSCVGGLSMVCFTNPRKTLL
jgi:hypothetical protein